MTAEQLRNSILQEAISGRLVPQDPNDEPASALLARIREEKERLVKEGKLKKKDLADTPITEEEIPFEIPSSWGWIKLKDLFHFLQGIQVDKEKQSEIQKDDQVRFLRIIDYTQGNEPPRYIDDPGERYHIKSKDLVMIRYGSPGLPCRGYDGVLANNLFRIIPYSESVLDREYTYRFFTSPYFQSFCNAYGVALSAIKFSTINEVLFSLPPLAEQKRIVAKLEELLPIVEQYGIAQKELDELNAALPARLRQSILQEAISGKLVPQDENDGNVDTLLDEVSRIKEQMLLRKEIKQSSLVSIPIEDEEIEYGIPDSWRFVRLQDICTCIFSGKSPKYSQIPTKHKIIGQQSNQWTGVEMKYIKYGTDEYAKDIPQIQYLQDHDVLLNTLGNGTLGRSGIYYSSYSNTPVLTDGHIFVLRTPHEVTAKYILAYLRVKFVDINRSADGSTNQTFLNLTKTSKWIIPLPPLAEQQRIVSKIEELFEQIDKISK